MAYAVLGLLDLDAVVAEEPRRVVHQILERHQYKVALANERMRQAQLFAAMDLAVHPQQVQVDGARTVDLGLLGAVAPQLSLDLHKLVEQHQRRQLGLDLDDGVGKRILARLVGRLALVDARAVGHAGERNLGDHVACGADVVATMPQVGAHGHKRTARLRLGDSPVTVQELRKAGNVVHAHDVGTGLDSAQAHAKRGGIARGRLGHARDGAHKTLLNDTMSQVERSEGYYYGATPDTNLLLDNLKRAKKLPKSTKDERAVRKTEIRNAKKALSESKKALLEKESAEILINELHKFDTPSFQFRINLSRKLTERQVDALDIKNGEYLSAAMSLPEGTKQERSFKKSEIRRARRIEKMPIKIAKKYPNGIAEPNPKELPQALIMPDGTKEERKAKSRAVKAAERSIKRYHTIANEYVQAQKLLDFL